MLFTNDFQSNVFMYNCSIDYESENYISMFKQNPSQGFRDSFLLTYGHLATYQNKIGNCLHFCTVLSTKYHWR